MMTTRTIAADRAADYLAMAKEGDPLDRIGAVLTAQESVNDLLHALVAEAREAGRSWTEIAIMLGTSKQAAHERFRA